MQCPRCPAKLIIGRVGGLSARGCPRCSGVWLDNDANAVLTAGLTDDSLASFRKHTARANVEVDEAAENLPCPVCTRTMRRHRVERAWLDVDICEYHGTWYDKGEVEQVSEAFDRPDAYDWRKGSAASPQEPTIEAAEGDRSDHLRGMLRAMRSISMRASANAEAILSRRGRDDDW
jgi:Zn-finger nucleic acid-binding protein